MGTEESFFVGEEVVGCIFSVGETGVDGKIDALV